MRTSESYRNVYYDIRFKKREVAHFVVEVWVALRRSCLAAAQECLHSCVDAS